MKSPHSPVFSLCVCLCVLELIMLAWPLVPCEEGGCRGGACHCVLPHSPWLGFHRRCLVRNQSLLAVTGTVTRGLIGPQATLWDAVRVLSLKPECGERLGCHLIYNCVFFEQRLK